MNLLLQVPVVVDVVRQPPVTPEITYPQVILSAFTVTGAIMLLALAVGLLTGGVIIFLKKRAEAANPVEGPSHARLQI